MKEQIEEFKLGLIKQAYDKLKDTEDYQRRNTTLRKYLICLEVDMTAPMIEPKLKALGIEL